MGPFFNCIIMQYLHLDSSALTSSTLKWLHRILFMVHRKIWNAITVTKHYISWTNSQRLKSYGLFLSMHLLDSVLQSLPHLMTSEKEICIMRTFSWQKLSAECDQQFYYKELSMRNVQPLEFTATSAYDLTDKILNISVSNKRNS
jgi:hypothetical protein